MNPDMKTQLAAVEVQMIMHGLDVVDILRFSGCNKFLRQASASTYAWKYARELTLSTNDMRKMAAIVQQLCMWLCTYKHSPLAYIKIFLKSQDQYWSKQGLTNLLETITTFPICTKQITGIDFNDCQIGHASCLILAKIIKLLNKITRLILGKNHIGHKCMILLEDAIKGNPVISTINLSFDCIGIGDKGVKSIANLIMYCPGLKEIDLSEAVLVMMVHLIWHVLSK